jgi:hypothetical protein
MINFRYHIVSLMAVFLALSVGIVIGVTLRPSVDSGLTQQAEQDRKTVQELRAEIDRRNALDKYREDYAARVDPTITAGLLTGDRVAVIVMPGAPSAVVDAIAKAVPIAGGEVTKTVHVDDSAFAATAPEKVDQALTDYGPVLGVADDVTTATRLGAALGRAVLAKEPVAQDSTAKAITKALSGAGLIAVEPKSTEQAQLAIVVTAAAPTTAPTADELAAHVQFDVALKDAAAGVVVAGPNSMEIQGTDVLAVRTDSSSNDLLSTVDVADLASGVTTVQLAGKEQLLGRQGHYGALTGAEAATPELPVR